VSVERRNRCRWPLPFTLLSIVRQIGVANRPTAESGTKVHIDVTLGSALLKTDSQEATHQTVSQSRYCR
jgi:hypothetical protein